MSYVNQCDFGCMCVSISKWVCVSIRDVWGTEGALVC